MHFLHSGIDHNRYCNSIACAYLWFQQDTGR